MKLYTAKFKPKLAVFAVTAVLAAISGILPIFSPADIYAGDIVINGRRISADPKPFNESGRTLVPIRFISENLGAEVDFDDESRLITISDGDTLITLTAADKTAYVNENEIELDVPSQIKDGRTFVPLRFIAEAFDCEVNYESESKLIFIASDDFDKKYVTAEDIPEYSGSPYIEMYYNTPLFKNIVFEAYENYGQLDETGRCTAAEACLGTELMPDEKRKSIGSIKPSGWQISKYDFIDGSYLFNRCHLIAFMLAGENDNPLNLITGTRYMNTEGMLPFETAVYDYIKSTNNHVMYRVTPIYSGSDPIAKGVLMEAYSAEDNGKGICFDIFAYNVQPGVKINYENGENYADDSNIFTAEETTEQTTQAAFSAVETQTSDETDTQNIEDILCLYPITPETPAENFDHILNIHTMKYHRPSCKAVNEMSDINKRGYNGSSEELIKNGFKPCGSCKPQ